MLTCSMRSFGERAQMADSMEEQLLALGLPKERVRLERWW